MAHENTWSSLEDGQPTGANLLGQVDDFVRQTRQMVRERIALEHDFNFLINDQQGYHRQGSARVWVSDTQPTSPIPDPTSTETVGSETIGRCWFKPSTGEYFVYNNASASWIPVNLTTLQMAALLHAMTAKTSLDDNDEFALADSVATYGPKKTLWSTVKSVIKTALSIGGSHALSEDNIGDGVSYKRISATKADKINAGTYSNDDIVDGASYKRIQAEKANALNSSTIVAGTIWSSGNDGNGGQPPIGKGKWLDGAPSNVNTWTDFVTLPNVKAKYLFLARVDDDNVAYFVSAFIATNNNGTMSMINYDQASTNLQIRIGSGQTLQVYQSAVNGLAMQYALILVTA